MAGSIADLLPRPSVMGVVNVTPDSFFDGGRFFAVDIAIAQARSLAAEGAAIVDVGGESTRPGSGGVSLEEELRRVVPVLEGLAEIGLPTTRPQTGSPPGLPTTRPQTGSPPAISIDTSKAEVARHALEHGAVMVNDVTALRADPELASVVAEQGAFLCLMHMLGEPRTMQDDPRYEDVVSEVAAFLEERLEVAVAAGVPEERICLDPGIGFGKTMRHNLELLNGLGAISALGRPILVGISRKRFLARILGDEEATASPLAASVAAAVLAYERGASIFRVHDVREHVQALAAARALEAA
jgi:dihydropteroate synthase